MNKCLILSLLLLMYGNCVASDEKVPSLLKIQLGKSLTECGVPECEKRQLGNGFMYTYKDDVLCWQADDGYTKYKNPNVIISTKGYFSLAKMASVTLDRSQANPATDKIIQASLNFDPDNTAQLISMLKNKYGKPTVENTSQVQNLAGAKFERKVAIWDFRNSRIELDQRYDAKNGMIFLKQGGYSEEVKKTQGRIKSDQEKL